MYYSILMQLLLNNLKLLNMYMISMHVLIYDLHVTYYNTRLMSESACARE